MRRKSKRFPVFFIFIVILIAIPTASLLIANTPYMRVKNDAIRIIQKKTEVKNFTKYYWYNHNASYFSVLGENRDQKDQYVIVDTSNGNLLIVDQNKGISENDAKKIVLRSISNANEVRSARLGIYKKKVVWEVSYFDDHHRLNYYTLDFKNGEILQKVLDV